MPWPFFHSHRNDTVRSDLFDEPGEDELTEEEQEVKELLGEEYLDLFPGMNADEILCELDEEMEEDGF